MKIWQWLYIMGMLSMICYYLSGREWMPLIVAFLFMLAGGLAFIFRGSLHE